MRGIPPKRKPWSVHQTIMLQRVVLELVEDLPGLLSEVTLEVRVHMQLHACVHFA